MSETLRHAIRDGNMLRAARRARRAAAGAECGCVPGHRMLVTTGRCEDCGLTEQQVVDRGNRPCSRIHDEVEAQRARRHHMGA
jgi:hypothetical protein